MKDKTPAELVAEGLVYACLTVASMVVFLYAVIMYFQE